MSQNDLEVEIPNPGSPEAVEQGCSCSPKRNNYGAGVNGNPNAFETDIDCYLHGDDSL